MSSAVSSGDLHQEHSASEQSLIVPVEQSHSTVQPQRYLKYSKVMHVSHIFE